MAPIDGHQDGRTITGFWREVRNYSPCLAGVLFVAVRRHGQVNTSEFATLSLVQTKNDFFNGPSNRVDASLPVAANAVLALLDDVAVPNVAGHSAWRLHRLYRNNSVFFFDQCLQPDKNNCAWLVDLEVALPTHTYSPPTKLGEVQPIDGGLRVGLVIHLYSAAARVLTGERVCQHRH